MGDVQHPGPGFPERRADRLWGQIGNNWFGDTLVLTFAPSIAAVGFNVVSEIDEPGATPGSAPITEVAYSGTTELGSRTVTEALGFFGIASTTPITEIAIFSDCDTDCSTNVSALSLAGTAGSGGAGTAVPESSGVGLFLTGLAGAGLLVSGRRR